MRRAALPALATALLAACGSTVDGDEGASADASPADASPGEPDAGACVTPPGSTSGKLVRLVYLVPSDREVDPVRLANLEHAFTDVRLWLRARMPQRTSFLAHEPLVEVVKTDHTEEHYRTTPNGDNPYYYFWQNAVADASAALGVMGDDPDNVWLIYADADVGCDQFGGGWIRNVALGSAADIRGLAQESQAPACPDHPTAPGPRCDYVGSMGNLLLGALGVPFPPGCADEDETTECDAERLIWLGRYEYPDGATLGPEDIEYLSDNPFMRAIGLPDCQLDCTAPVAP